MRYKITIGMDFKLESSPVKPNITLGDIHVDLVGGTTKLTPIDYTISGYESRHVEFTNQYILNFMPELETTLIYKEVKEFYDSIRDTVDFDICNSERIEMLETLLFICEHREGSYLSIEPLD